MLVGSTVRRVAILGGTRIPFARAHGAYANVGNQEMLTAALGAVVERYRLAGQRLGEVAAGAVMKHSKDFNLVRECVLSVGLDPQTPAFDLQRACGTSLEAAIAIGNKIALGQIEVGIAGGVDTVSDTPIVYSRAYQQLLLSSYRGRSAWQRISPFLGLRPHHFKPVFPGAIEPRTGLSMGQSCELMAKQWQIARADQDQLAFESHSKAAAAWKDGFFSDLVTPFNGLAADNNVRGDTSVAKLASLRPTFDTRGTGTLTAGNSTPLTDGASAALLASEDWARAHDLPVQAWLTYGKAWAVDFVERPRRPADGARLCGARDARRRRPHAAGFRLLRNPRSLRRPGAVHAEGLGIPRVLPRPARPRHAARQHRPREAQREGQQPRRRPPVRGDRHAHRGLAREAAGGQREREAWAHLGVHGGRDGGDGDTRAGVSAGRKR